MFAYAVSSRLIRYIVYGAKEAELANQRRLIYSERQLLYWDRRPTAFHDITAAEVMQSLSRYSD